MTHFDEPDPDRLRRLEESHGFAEHALEQLSAEMATMNRRLAELTARVARLETRLQRLAAPPEASEERSDQE
jgi:uncharacterized coiled-coil protein SlyX